MAKLSADTLLDELARLHDETWGALTSAKQQGDLGHMLAAVREGRANVEAFGRLGPLAEIETRIAALEQRGTHADPATF